MDDSCLEKGSPELSEALWQAYRDHVVRCEGGEGAGGPWPETARDRVRKGIHRAVARVRPRNHVERVFAFWCGLHGREGEIDEYLRRREPRPSRRPDHPLLDLGEWNVPDTARLIVFREQVVALFRKLCDPLLSEGEIDRRVDSLRCLMSEEESFQVFRPWVRQDLRQGLAEEELAAIHAALWQGMEASWSYCWHSVLVSRAEGVVSR